jgi:BON domain-containing protein
MQRFQPNQERDMNIPRKKRILILCAYLGPAVCGLAGFATPVGAQTPVVAQNAVLPPASRSDSVAVSATPDAAVLSNEELEERVKAALHADPYFYDEHVSVSVEQGAVVLRGFVFSGWDLQQAIRIAGKAAGDRRVIDNLSIQQGGRR